MHPTHLLLPKSLLDHELLLAEAQALLLCLQPLARDKA